MPRWKPWLSRAVRTGAGGGKEGSSSRASGYLHRGVKGTVSRDLLPPFFMFLTHLGQLFKF